MRKIRDFSLRTTLRIRIMRQFRQFCVKIMVIFTWGKDGHEAVHNAVVLEEVAKMAARCELINPKVQPAPQELQDKHYYKKHGANAYYGQGK